MSNTITFHTGDKTQRVDYFDLTDPNVLHNDTNILYINVHEEKCLYKILTLLSTLPELYHLSVSLEPISTLPEIISKILEKLPNLITIQIICDVIYLVK